MLPESDAEYLQTKGWSWELQPSSGGEALLIIKGYEVSAERFDRGRTDLMLRIPAGYPLAGLDMFYVEPAVRTRAALSYPPQADVFEDHGGRRWQRFSRHLPTPWRAGEDGVSTLIALIGKELH